MLVDLDRVSAISRTAADTEKVEVGIVVPDPTGQAIFVILEKRFGPESRSPGIAIGIEPTGVPLSLKKKA